MDSLVSLEQVSLSLTQSLIEFRCVADISTNGSDKIALSR